jgi:hypothetical protein
MRPTALCNSIGSVTDERATVGWRDVLAVVKTSAIQRLGMPLLLTYLVLALFGIAVVAVSLLGTYPLHGDGART